MKTPTPTGKLRKNRRFVTLEILRRRFQVFVEADKEIAKLSGASPGVEVLMASQIEAEADARDLACHLLLQGAKNAVRAGVGVF